MLATVDKNDLVKLGYTPSYAANIIRQTKACLVEQGFGLYKSKKLGRVPAESVSGIVGFDITESISNAENSQHIQL